MAEFRYRAFISYSHRDEQWGRWLQRALENYRVPRRLVGSKGEFGPIPRRLSPVFRDREDLSSAADLTSSVKVELEASETLVVICSPSAVASPWVNEEIEYFRRLGRGDRILALIVEGDPQSEDPAEQCFPPALTQGDEGRSNEPLAADARKWADGKSLARLKLVAGILGIRLDDLRQRDMQRKHRLWAIAGSGAMAIAILTSVLAVIAITARNQAENRRQHAEDLVDYMVDDLKRKLDEVGRLDILEGMGDEVSRYLETLDPREETEESLLQKAKVWRQLGEVAMSQAKLDDAMAAFAASREVTRELLRRAPSDTERVYEMAQSEFWVGFVHLEKGEYSHARQAFDQYLEYAQMLTEIDPSNPEWVLEQSYAHGNIATLLIQQESDDVSQILEEVETAAELNRKALQIDPDNQAYLSELGNAIAWVADTQLLFCDLGGALRSRQENVEIARETLASDPGNAHRQRRYAWSLSGLSNVATQVGLVDYAIELWAEAVDVLERLYASDPSNLDIQWDALIRKSYIELLLAETGPDHADMRKLDEIEESLQQLLESENSENQRRRKEWANFQLRFADMAWRSGDRALGADRLKSVIQQIAHWVESNQDIQEWRHEVVRAKFLIWHWANMANDSGGDEPVTIPGAGDLPATTLEPASPHSSCEERSLSVLQSLLKGNLADAERDVRYLREKGYYEPGFIRICQQYDLCQGAR